MKGDFAYMPGTGPEARFCRDCVFILAAQKTGKCAKAAELRHSFTARMKPIPLMTRACKYFEARS